VRQEEEKKAAETEVGRLQYLQWCFLVSAGVGVYCAADKFLLLLLFKVQRSSVCCC